MHINPSMPSPRNNGQVASGYVITPEAVSTAGAVSYWRLTGTIDLKRLADAWAAAGLAAEMLPKPPGDEVALGRAVRDQANRNRLVRRLKNGNWLVVDETPATDGSTAKYDVIASVAYDKERPHHPRISYQSALRHNASQQVAFDDAILSAYATHQGQLEPEDISTWLVKIANKLSAVSLRDTGGIYFVPRNNAELWAKIVNTVRSVSSHQIFQIPAMKNADAIAAITAAITEEAEQAVARVYEELQQTGDAKLGAKALKTRTAEAAKLLAKIEEYETLVESRIAARSRVEDLQAALSTASLSVGEE